MIKVGDVWRLIDAPGETPTGGLSGTIAQGKSGDGDPRGPSEKARELMEEYEKLDKADDHSARANQR